MTTPTAVDRPVKRPVRLPFLDVLRGIAILGTLGTNIWLFTANGAEGSLLWGSGAVSANQDSVVESAFRFAANGKFLSLLTILFGVGLAIQFASAAKRGRRWPGKYRWRAAFLFLEGSVHFVFVFAFDVLMGYAVVALLVAKLLTRSARFQRVAMWTAAGLHLTFMALLTLAGLWGEAGQDQQEATRPDPAVVDLYANGDYLAQVAFRLENIGIFRLEPVLTFGLLVFLFSCGVALFRAGAFGPDGARIRSAMLWWGLGVGLPFNIACTMAGSELALLDRYVAAPIVAIGYIGLVGRVMDRLNPGPMIATLSSLGRAALSGYVFQNLLASLICYGFGLGLAERFGGEGPWWVIGLWLGISAFLLLGARLWLHRFDHGPLEALQKRVLGR